MENRRQQGAEVLDNLEIDHVDKILNPNHSGEMSIMMAEFKSSINDYLKELDNSPVRSLADIIAFNESNPELVCIFNSYILLMSHGCVRIYLSFI